MPLRRRPPAPSPRVRAILSAGRGATGPVDEGGPSDRRVRPGAATAHTSAAHTSAVNIKAAAHTTATVHSSATPWRPERDWVLASPPSASASVGATRARPRRPSSPSPPGRHRRPSPPAPQLFTIPKALRGASLTAPRAATVGLLLVALLAGGLFAGRVVLARAASAPRPIRASDGSGSALTGSTSPRTVFGQPGAARAQRATAGAQPEVAGVSAGGSAGRAAAGTVTVHVVGQVRHPGVVTLASGSRVVDAVAKAGGALPAADLPALNLARVLVDGEQVRVTRPGEPPPMGDPAGAVPTAGAAGGSGAGGAGAGGGAALGAGAGSTGSVLNLNQATAAQLEELPGVGPVLAQRIVEWRTAHGRFATVDELSEVSGIGDKIFAELQTRVTV